jgi:RND family efflux transporter MFP subunit
MKTRPTCRGGFLLLLALAGGLVGCERPPAPPDEAVVVVVSQPLKREVTDYVNFTGKTAAVESVDVRPRVSGYLKEIGFEPGAEVKKGQVLFVIDPRPYKNALDRALASIQRDKAAVKRTAAEAERARRLIGSASISRADWDKAMAEAAEAVATLELHKAEAETARLDYDWTKVTAEIPGKASRTKLTVGNLIEKDKTVLTTIVSLEPIWAYFDADDQTMLRFQDLQRAGKLKTYEEGKFPVFLGLSGSTDFPYQGTIDFVDNKLNPGTGTIQVRGVFPNKDHTLTPEMFVRIRVPIGSPHKAILVNENALGSDQGQKYLLVVTDKNQVVRRNVRVGELNNGLREILAGLGPDEWVITDGVQRVRPGLTVNPTRQPMPELPGGVEPAKGK